MALHASLLFADDFDLPSEPDEPEVIEPVFSAAELAEAREAGWHDGHASTLAEAAASDEAAVRQAIEAIAAEFATAREAAAREAGEAADAIARLLLNSLAAVLPTLCARHGDDEMQALVRAVLPALSQEPEVTVRIGAESVEAISSTIARIDPDLASRVHVVPCGTLPIGDVRISWRNGTATRDASALWRQVAAILMPAGLLDEDKVMAGSGPVMTGEDQASAWDHA